MNVDHSTHSNAHNGRNTAATRSTWKGRSWSARWPGVVDCWQLLKPFQMLTARVKIGIVKRERGLVLLLCELFCIDSVFVFGEFSWSDKSGRWSAGSGGSFDDSNGCCTRFIGRTWSSRRRVRGWSTVVNVERFLRIFRWWWIVVELVGSQRTVMMMMMKMRVMRSIRSVEQSLLAVTQNGGCCCL